MKQEKTDPRRGIRMKSELEILVYKIAVEAWKIAKEFKGNPIEWYAENRVYLGFKTLTRRFSLGNWEFEELERIYRDTKTVSASLAEELKAEIVRRFQ
jgi:hypothetical protein